jgi:hypothetical protein
MSKNIYRVNKKSDVDIIFKNNLLKPIFLVFVDNKTDDKLINEIEKTLLLLSKKNTYSVTLLINFDKFTDEMNFFNQYNENLPSFVSFFLGQQVTEYSNENSSNFISIIVSIIEKIHLNYVSKLNVMFTDTTNNNIPQNQSNENVIISPNNIPHIEQTMNNKLEHVYNEENSNNIDYEKDKNNIEGSDNDTDEIRLKKEKLKLLLKQKELLEIQKNN